MLGALLLLGTTPLVRAAAVVAPRLASVSAEQCPGYKAVNAHGNGDSFTADLTLAGKPCNTYGTDLKDLRLVVEYQSGNHSSLSS